MSKKVAGTSVPRSEQTKILHMDCWTSGLLVSCRSGSRPEDQKTRKPSYGYWSAVHVEVLILLVAANVQINKWNWLPAAPSARRRLRRKHYFGLLSCAHNPSSAASAMSFSSLGAGKSTPGTAIHQPVPIPTLRPSM